ncbi:DUF1538 family protein [Nitrospira sp. MA-1]|nr:DUF1538 family protein [Nitrospira sp. MA-1]
MTGLKTLCWIGFSVGLAAAIGTMRFLYGWSLKPFIYGSLTPMLALTFSGASDPDLTKVLGLAWDAGAVTTRPVTVPLFWLWVSALRWPHGKAIPDYPVSELS